MMKNQKGITLIALVITIIVLLILAGVSIAMLTGDNGLLGRSQQAVKDNAIAGAKDELATEVQAIVADFLQEKYSSTNSNDQKYYAADAAQKYVMTELTNEYNGQTVRDCSATVNSTEKSITLTYDNRTVKGTIDTEGTLSWGAIQDVPTTPGG